jgi:uncharacterized damage-inducible protein DinB
MTGMLEGFRKEFLRYKTAGEKALAQVSDDALNRILSTDGNSMAMVVRHIGGNLVSRFTDFLTTDGDKPWRKRDSEFETRSYTRGEVEELWRRGWAAFEKELGSLSEADLAKTVHIRGEAMPAHEALLRAAAHTSYHVGQIVLLARISCESEWKWISLPKKKPSA